jgi:hypothetical protein
MNAPSKTRFGATQSMLVPAGTGVGKRCAVYSWRGFIRLYWFESALALSEPAEACVYAFLQREVEFHWEQAPVPSGWQSIAPTVIPSIVFDASITTSFLGRAVYVTFPYAGLAGIGLVPMLIADS